MDYAAAGRLRQFQVNELDEWRQIAYENNRLYKERAKRLHYSKIEHPKHFKEGNLVFLYNSRLRLFPEKLKSKRSGPFFVKKVFPYGVVEVEHLEKGIFKVNSQQLKFYHGGTDLEEGRRSLSSLRLIE